MGSGFPLSGMELTHILAVKDLERAKKFYGDVLGTAVHHSLDKTWIPNRFDNPGGRPLTIAERFVIFKVP
ncbi:MAG: hypothetical protein JSV89_06990 [Spirochaetaceae bacterium]|nr:MAG: hypothetical protein JSV89_06990 [Spirochaetaceae bacterium]